MVNPARIDSPRTFDSSDLASAQAWEQFCGVSDLSGDAHSSEIKVILLADRGFVHTDLMRQLTDILEWHYSDSLEERLLDLAFKKRHLPASRFSLQARRGSRPAQRSTSSRGTVWPHSFPLRSQSCQRRVFGQSPVTRRRAYRRFVNMDCGLILRKILWMTSQTAGIFKGKGLERLYSIDGR